MKPRNLPLVLPILLFLTACTGPQRVAVRPLTSNTAVLKTTLRTLHVENPGADLNLNVANGDYRFLSICGFVAFYPGVKDEELPMISKYGTRILEGTSDMIEGNEHGALVQQAEEYARTYNRLLVEYLASQHEP